MAGVKKFLDYFVKIESEEPTGLSDEELQKILAEGDPPKGAPARPASPRGAAPAPAPQAPPAKQRGAAAPPLDRATGLPVSRTPPRVADVSQKAVAQVQPPSPGNAAPDSLPDFETIYRAAKVPDPPHGYTIDKVAVMLNNPRLAGMSESVKANSVLMALEVAGVPINDVIADAVARDRAIDDFEAWWAAKVAEIESTKRAENAAIEDEMNRYLETQRERIRANNAAVQKAHETFTSWKDTKRVEERRLYDHVQPFVTENPVTLNTGTLGTVAAAPGTPCDPSTPH